MRSTVRDVLRLADSLPLRTGERLVVVEFKGHQWTGAKRYFIRLARVPGVDSPAGTPPPRDGTYYVDLGEDGPGELTAANGGGPSPPPRDRLAGLPTLATALRRLPLESGHALTETYLGQVRDQGGTRDTLFATGSGWPQHWVVDAHSGEVIRRPPE